MRKRLCALLCSGIIGLASGCGGNGDQMPQPGNRIRPTGRFIWIGGSGSVLAASRDGGETWTREILPPATEVIRLDFSNENHGWAAGELLHFIADVVSFDHRLARTTDGGETWVDLGSAGDLLASSASSHPSEVPISDMDFSDAANGWLAMGGEIFHTSDGGNTWEKQFSMPGMGIKSIMFISNAEGWAVGGNFLILHTLDGGKTWAEQEVPQDLEGFGRHASMDDVEFVDNLTGWAVASGSNFRIAIIGTKNGGAKWEVLSIQHTDQLDVSLSKIDFVNHNSGWILVDTQALFHSTDDGKTWIRQSIPSAVDRIDDIAFVNDERGWAVGRASVFRTDDGGSTWQEVETVPFHPKTVIALF